MSYIVGFGHFKTQFRLVDPQMTIINFQCFILFSPQVGAVVVGFDEYFSYQKMGTALQYLVDDSIHFIATNKDSRGAIGNGKVAPGIYHLS